MVLPAALPLRACRPRPQPQLRRETRALERLQQYLHCATAHIADEPRDELARRREDEPEGDVLNEPDEIPTQRGDIGLLAVGVYAQWCKMIDESEHDFPAPDPPAGVPALAGAWSPDMPTTRTLHSWPCCAPLHRSRSRMVALVSGCLGGTTHHPGSRHRDGPPRGAAGSRAVRTRRRACAAADAPRSACDGARCGQLGP